MTTGEAREILMLHRDGVMDATDPAMAQALALAQQDPELRRWFEEHRRFQTEMRARFNEIEVPSELRARLRNFPVRKIVHPPQGWHQVLRWAAAAIVLGLIALTTLWLKPRIPDRFADYRSRMVRTVLREYRMDIRTNDMAQIRRYMNEHGAPGDYVVPPGLVPLQLTGGGFLRWRNQPVSMVCFNRGDNQMLFLFVMNQASVKDPPSAKPSFSKVNKLVTASWTGGGKTYILAGPEDPDFVQRYLVQ